MDAILAYEYLLGIVSQLAVPDKHTDVHHPWLIGIVGPLDETISLGNKELRYENFFGNFQVWKAGTRTSSSASGRDQARWKRKKADDWL